MAEDVVDGFTIKTMDSIAQEGLELLGDRYLVSSGEPDPQGIVVRSSQVDVDAFPNLLAVARVSC